MRTRLTAFFPGAIAARASLLGVLLLLVFTNVGRAQEASGRAHARFDLENPASGRRHLVGHVTRLLNVTGTLGEIRPVNVHLWYPARKPDGCEDSGDQGCSMIHSVYTSRLYGIPLPSPWAPLSWTIVGRESFDNLPIDTDDRPFPVIVFSHGNEGNAIDYVYTLESLASFGFIVAAPDHLNNTEDDDLIDFINTTASKTVIHCFDGLPTPCARGTNVPKSMTDRVHDISAIIDALPTWFGNRADTSRVGVMGHSRGTVTALAAAGGSTAWGIKPEHRVKAIMGLAIGGRPITFGADVQEIKMPALLVAGTLDMTAPFQISLDAFNELASTKREFVLIGNAKHRHFDSGMCAQTQSSGAVAAANPNAVLDLQSLINTLLRFPVSGAAMDFCGYETFTNPTDVTDLVRTLTGFSVTANNVPTTGLTSDAVKDEVIDLAVDFFGHVLEPDSNDNRPFTDFLP